MQLTRFLKRSHATPGITTTKGEAREIIVMRDTAAMRDTTTMCGTTRAGEIMAAEERRSRSVISMTKTKAIERMNAPSHREETGT